MNENAPAEIRDTPGARAARQQPNAREQRMTTATDRLRGSSKLQDTHVRPNHAARHPDAVDRTTLKWTAQNELEQAESRAEQERQQEALAQEHKTLTASLEAEAGNWLEQGLAAGWINAEGDVSPEADPDWIAAGHELAEYVDEGYEQ